MVGKASVSAGAEVWGDETAIDVVSTALSTCVSTLLQAVKHIINEIVNIIGAFFIILFPFC